MSFEKDLQNGKKWERIICECLIDKGFKAQVIEVKSNFDIIDLNTDLKFEVKHDKGSQGSNNVAIEIKCSGEPSGVSTSLATYWVHVWYLDNRVVYNIIPVWMLKRYLKQFRSEIKIVSDAGDGNTTVCLVPKEIFKHWRIHNEIPQRYLTADND